VKSITLICDFAGDKKTVEVTQPNGASGAWHVMIENYFQGQIVKNNGEWVAYLQKGTILTGDDVSVVIDMIEKESRE
jgi:hypothetical protein